MALPTITLDDRTFDQLFAFMRRQIDVAEWVDHNHSDPGIALLDLLCWIGEMALYTADRIPPAHIEKFASLVIDPPEPVTVQLTLTAAAGAFGTLPEGTRFATDFAAAAPGTPARRVVFETIEPVVFKATALPQARAVTARELLVVKNEVLGTSDGSPNQTFQLQPSHVGLGVRAGRPLPIVTDFVHASPIYQPNPVVKVGAALWTPVQFLATEASRVTAANPTPTHYMVDAAGRVTFGDGRNFGSIPPAGQSIECVSYRVLQGGDALIAADEIRNQLDPGPATLGTLAIENSAAEGGRFFFTPGERIAEGLRRFNRASRLITAADFEAVMMIDFNEAQRLSRDLELRRAVALMNVNLSAPEAAAPGHVTIVVLVSPTADLDASLTDPGPVTPPPSPAALLADLATKQALVTPPWQVADKLRRFLDRRRLLTTRVHVAAPTKTAATLMLPKLVGVAITTIVAIDGDRNDLEMKSTIEGAIRKFLGVVSGGADGKGWPLGGSVYRSKLFRLLEDIDGVDHVETLTLARLDALGSTVVDPSGDVTLEPLTLPAISRGGLTVTTVRA